MNTIGSLLATALTIGGLLFVNHYDGSTALRPWSTVNPNAYLDAVNNSRVDLPVVVRAPAVDSATRYLGMVPKCGHIRFKLPYADTQIILTIGSVNDTMTIDGPGIWSITIFDSKDPCPYVAKIAAKVADFVDPMNWQSSPWYRPGNVGTPAKLVLAGDGTVCAVYQQEIEQTRPGDVYTCKTDWIIPR
jgi:hypothetical protein